MSVFVFLSQYTYPIEIMIHSFKIHELFTLGRW